MVDAAPQSDRELAIRMVPLLERGAEAFRAHYASLPQRERPQGGAMSVVTQDDYIAHPLLCLHHALANGPLHILLSVHGSLFAQLARLTRQR